MGTPIYSQAVRSTGDNLDECRGLSEGSPGSALAPQSALQTAAGSLCKLSGSSHLCSKPLLSWHLGSLFMWPLITHR